MSRGSINGIDVMDTPDAMQVILARGAVPRARQALVGAVCLALVGAGVLGGCQRNTPESLPPVSSLGNHPPVVRAISLQPVPLVLTGPVVAYVEARDLDRNPLRFRYQWRINGEPVPGQEGEQLRVDLLKRGDQVSVQVWPHDGQVEGASMTSEPSVVGNSPPVGTTVEIDPQSVFPDARVRVHAAVSDADGDAIHVVYRWLKNGKLIHEGEEAEFDAIGFVRGDTLAVEAVPSDGTSSGAVIRSAVMPVGNTPPRIISDPAKTVTESLYRYQVKATDAESDAITFSLETAPPGMQINAQTGLVTWAIESGQIGAHKVRVLAKDSQGAVAFQEFELNLTTVAPPQPAGA